MRPSFRALLELVRDLDPRSKRRADVEQQLLAAAVDAAPAEVLLRALRARHPELAIGIEAPPPGRARVPVEVHEVGLVQCSVVTEDGSIVALETLELRVRCPPEHLAEVAPLVAEPSGLVHLSFPSPPGATPDSPPEGAEAPASAPRAPGRSRREAAADLVELTSRALVKRVRRGEDVRRQVKVLAALLEQVTP